MKTYLTSPPLLSVLLSIACVLTSHAATLTHDSLHRLTAVDYADGTRIAYPYDAAGNPLTPIISRPATLSILVDPPNSGTTTGAGRFLSNTTQALTATPASAFDFVGWLRTDGTLLSPDQSYAHPITDTETLTARFVRVQAPTITTHPTGASITAGAPLSLNVVVEGRPPFTYQWQHNGSLLHDGGATFTRPSTSFLDAGTYAVEVTNPGGTTRSNSALITIPISDYTTWRNVVFSPAEIAANDPALIGPGANVGTDGKDNLLNYALGAKDRFRAPLNAMSVDSNYQFTFNRLIGGGGLNYKVGISSDLAVWDEFEDKFDVTSIPNDDGITETAFFTIKPAFRPDYSRAFFRLKVSQSIASGNFSDEFDGQSLDFSKWNLISTANVSVSAGIASSSSSSQGWNSMFTTQGKHEFSGRRITIEWRMRRLSDFDAYLIIRDVTDILNSVYCMDSNYRSAGLTPGLRVSRGGIFGESHIGNGNPTTAWKEYRLVLDGSSVVFQRGSTLAALDETINDTLSVPIAGKTFFLSLGAAGNSCTAEFDWVRVKTEP